MKEGYFSVSLNNPVWISKKKVTGSETTPYGVVYIPKIFLGKDVWVVIPRDEGNDSKQCNKNTASNNTSSRENTRANGGDN